MADQVVDDVSGKVEAAADDVNVQVDETSAQAETAKAEVEKEAVVVDSIAAAPSPAAAASPAPAAPAFVSADGPDGIKYYHVMSVEQCTDVCQTDLNTGLTAEEAKARLERDGPNKLTEAKKRTIWERIWDQINNVLVFILIVVAIISAIKGATSTGEDAITSWIEVVLIIGVVCLNTWIGIRQEGAAEKSADALKAMLSSEASIKRDGVLQTVPAEEIVYGDIVKLGLGEKIPADLRIFKTSNLATGEAALTGEAMPIDKIVERIETDTPKSVPLGDRKNLAYSATTVMQGEGWGIVVKTGDDTEIGEINSLVSRVEKKKTNVLVQIDMVSRFIAVFVIITAIVTFLVAFLVTGQEPLVAVSTALVTAVAMIPEGLAAIVTLTYAWAVSKMAKENAIVRVLPAVETLGSVTVICSDKTGTLTQNVMSMVAFVTSNGRFKVDVNATDRNPKTFVRDDSYAPTSGEEDAEAAAAGVEKAATAPAPAEKADSAANGTEPDSETGPKNGESPDVDFVRSMLATGVLCSHSQLGVDGGREGEMGNPTEIAIVRAAYKAGCDEKAMRQAQPCINEIPFSSEYKFMATSHEPLQDVDGTTDGIVLHVKGAVDRLMPVCKYQAKGGIISPDAVEDVDREYWLTQAEEMSSFGLRVLCLCRATIKKGDMDDSTKDDFVLKSEPFLTVVGLACILDPPRPECVDSIKLAHGAGVRVAMITGDHKATAVAIGKMLGIVDNKYSSAVTGPELDAMSDIELRQAVMKYNVFARASPENKISIVKALQAEKQVSSMTGDGVNDAPALKAADMGVAMGKEGTDVAREAAEMILADDNFATIVVAVREGRVVWDNLRKVLLFNTPVNNAQGMTVLFGMVFGLPYAPLTPIQVLYCNLICAVTLGFVLAVEPAEDGIMKQPPRRVGKRLIGRYLLFRIAYATVMLVTLTVGSVFLARNVFELDPDFPLQTVAELGGECEYDIQLTESDGLDASGNDLPSGVEICCENTIIFNPVDTKYTCPNTDGRNLVRAQASNTLTISAISVMLSARFSYNSGFSSKLLYGNAYAWYSALITFTLQLCITYIPGLNNLVFGMGPMTGQQWAAVFVAAFLMFGLMEIEKGIMRYLKSQKYDTDDDKEEDQFFVAPDEETGPIVDQASQRSAVLHDSKLKK